MTRFLICDTDPEFLTRLAGALHQFFDPCSVEYLFGPSALEASLQADSGGADILLTEIELRRQNAIDIIRDNLKESAPLQVIYITPKMEYCTDVYETRHCGFLLKPVKLQLLRRDVTRALQALERKRRCGIVLQKSGSIHIISAPSLLYAEGRGHTVRAVTDSESLETYEKLADFAFRLDNRFLQCHKSYIINMERVRKYCGDSFVMDNDVAIPVSQSRRREVRERFTAYIGVAEKEGQR